MGGAGRSVAFRGARRVLSFVCERGDVAVAAWQASDDGPSGCARHLYDREERRVLAIEAPRHARIGVGAALVA